MNKRIITEEIMIPQLGRKRKLRVYLPLDYKKSNKRYPVLYMHDGQNLFDTETAAFGDDWEIDKTLNDLERNDKFQGIIVVGVDNNDTMEYGFGRLNEYSPWKNSDIGKHTNWRGQNLSLGGEGDKYATFIAKTLKPKIDQEYRTLSDRSNTAIAGSSMGGLISLYIGLKYQDIFSKIGGLSNAFWFAEDEMLNFIDQVDKKEDMKIYLDVGTQETSEETNLDFPEIYKDTNERVYKKLKEKFDEVKFKIEEGAKHNEKYWAIRFPEVIRYFGWL
ncbi:MAG: alpha/beta hydrolase [Fusobacteriota bacterium]